MSNWINSQSWWVNFVWSRQIEIDDGGKRPLAKMFVKLSSQDHKRTSKNDTRCHKMTFVFPIDSLFINWTNYKDNPQNLNLILKWGMQNFFWNVYILQYREPLFLLFFLKWSNFFTKGFASDKFYCQSNWGLKGVEIWSRVVL